MTNNTSYSSAPNQQQMSNDASHNAAPNQPPYQQLISDNASVASYLYQQQVSSNVPFNNNTISSDHNHDSLNNTSHYQQPKPVPLGHNNHQQHNASNTSNNDSSLHNHQQSTSDIASPPPQHADQNPFFLPLNSLNITISNSPQTSVRK